LQQIGIRAHVFELSKMPLETRFLPRRKKTG
jgi:hypothetical protein